MSDQWLTKETVRPEAERLIDAIRKERDERSRTGRFDVYNQAEATAVNQSSHSLHKLTNRPFYASVGIVNGPDQETWYLSTVSHANRIPGDQFLVPWTNWVGDLAVKARDALQDGGLPGTMIYGPPDKAEEAAIGPFVEYDIHNTRLTEFRFHAPGGKDAQEPLVKPDEQAFHEEKPEFGLKEIIRTIDVPQNDRIRGPKSGVFIFEGGPGVGKTTVALHRIPFLINEQKSDQLSYEQQEALDPDEFLYRQDRTLIVVWKKHLVPYLRRCVDRLGLLEIPDQNVCHVDHWIDTGLQGSIQFGRKSGVKKKNDSSAIASIKLQLTDVDLDEFLTSEHPLKHASYTSFAKMTGTINRALKNFDLDPIYPQYQGFTAVGIASTAQSILDQLPQFSEHGYIARFGRRSEYTKEQDKLLRDEVRNWKRREIESTKHYVDLLRLFYRSDVSRQKLGDAIAYEALSEAVEHQNADRTISDVDRYFLLWMIYRLTGVPGKSSRDGANRQYSHIVVDEAQYYHPIILRLFHEIISAQEGALTIVGDLEQRTNSNGGLTSWDDIGIFVPQENRAVLSNNYRWSRWVFAFLEMFREAAKIEAILRPPRQWLAGEGWIAEIFGATNQQDEINRIVERLQDLRESPETEYWSVAVVVPDNKLNSMGESLLSAMKQYCIDARRATGQDVQESVDQIIITDFDSVVGLEFDAVFVIGAEDTLANPSQESIRAVWVALTRAKKFLHVSHCGSIPIFDRQEFQDLYVS